MKKLPVILLILILIFTSGCSSGKPAVEPTASPDTANTSPPLETAEPPAETQTPAPTAAVPSPSPAEASPEPSPEATPDEGENEAAGTISAYIDSQYRYTAAERFSAQLRSFEPELGFSIDYCTEYFVPVFSNNTYRFIPVENTSEENGSASPGTNTDAGNEAPVIVFMEISLINGITAEELAPSFMDTYINFTDIEFSSFTPVGTERLSAECVTAYNREQYLEAYLVNVSGGTAAIVISSSSNVSAEYYWFKAMLNTMLIF